MPFPLIGLLIAAARIAAPIIIRQVVKQGVKQVAKQTPKQIAKQAASQGTKGGLKQTVKQAVVKKKAAGKTETKKKICTQCDEAAKNQQSKPYSHLKDHKSVGPGKDFTKSQKDKLLKANEQRNGGVLKSDKSGEALVRPMKHQKGVSPPKNEAHIDHAIPKSKGGPNSNANARVLSREENLKKGAKNE